MTFIPNNNRISNGDTVRLKKEFVYVHGKFTIGHEFTVHAITPFKRFPDDALFTLKDCEEGIFIAMTKTEIYSYF